MTGAAFGRQLSCIYYTLSPTLWPNSISCYTPQNTDFSAYYESEKHSFYLTGSSVSKSTINTFYIWDSQKLDFIPLDILTEFPNLNGLLIDGVNLPTLKAGLFKPELQKIEYLYLSGTIETIEPEAFQYLINLKWIFLYGHNLQTLPYRLFKNNPDLIFIGLGYKINSIHSSFFDGLNKLKLVDFSRNVGCIKGKIGCETCLITQSELRGKLQGCFDNCSNGTACHTSFLSYEASQTTEIPQTTTENPIESNSTENEGITEIKSNTLEELFQNLTQGLEQVSQDNKLAIEGVEVRLLNITNDLKNSVENMPKVIEKAIETNNQNMQECCTSNEKAVEKLQDAMENQIKHSKKVEKELKELKENLVTKVEKSLKEGLAEISRNQLQPGNLQTNESAELLEARLEIMKLKMENLEFKCAKKDSEIESLKGEIEEKKDIESQLKSLEKKFDEQVEKLDSLMNGA
jgi:hypothetical protein